LLARAEGAASEQGSGQGGSLAGWQLKISDFGLARKLDEQGQTPSGSVLGTPSYMAPEQAEGHKQVGHTADLYSLGAILYELLTGRPPFQGETPVDTILQVLADPLLPPSRLRPDLPADLEAVCLKCLEKRPADRYHSAEELAEDLQRFLDGLPTRARPATPQKEVISGFFGPHRELLRRFNALSVRTKLLFVVPLLVQFMIEMPSSWRLAMFVGEMLAALILPRVYRDWIERTRVTHTRAHVAASLTLPPDLLRGHEKAVTDLAFFPSGEMLATTSSDGTTRLWNRDASQARAPLSGHNGAINALAVFPDGQALLTGGADGTVRRWDVQTGREESVLLQTTLPVTRLLLSPQGHFVVVLLSGRPLDTRTEWWAKVRTFFAPDKQRLVLLEPSTGQELAAVEEGPPTLFNTQPGLGTPALSRDGRLLAVRNASEVRVWEVSPTGELTERLALRPGRLGDALAFSSDGQAIAVGRVSSAEQPKGWLG
jgi:hypothetical protein